LDVELADGRFFTAEDRNGSNGGFVINETAARQLNSGTIVGKEIQWFLYENREPLKGRVIGVVKDFHFQSLHEPVLLCC
jgi:putative ABC transport system permease protein